jgi:general secretion pathway protein N
VTRVATAWSRVLVLFALIVAFSIALAPATLVDARIAKATDGRVRLADARGFWWRGSGIVSTSDGRALVPVAWRVDMPALLRGALAVDLVDAAGSGILGTLTAHDDVTTIRDVRATIPAASIAALDRRLDVLTVGGNLALDVPSLALSANARSGNLRVVWARAGVVAGDTLVDLGNVSLDTRTEGDRLAGTIRNAGGDVAVDGKLAIAVDAIDVSATVRPQAMASEKLRNALSRLGVPDAAGGVQIEFHERR